MVSLQNKFMKRNFRTILLSALVYVYNETPYYSSYYTGRKYTKFI